MKHQKPNRFGLVALMSFADVGKALGISGVRVQQIERVALEKLRREAKRLRLFE